MMHPNEITGSTCVFSQWLKCSQLHPASRVATKEDSSHRVVCLTLTPSNQSCSSCSVKHQKVLRQLRPRFCPGCLARCHCRSFLPRSPPRPNLGSLAASDPPSAKLVGLTSVGTGVSVHRLLDSGVLSSESLQFFFHGLDLGFSFLQLLFRDRNSVLLQLGSRDGGVALMGFPSGEHANQVHDCVVLDGNPLVSVGYGCCQLGAGR